jgi:hypothetical protein
MASQYVRKANGEFAGSVGSGRDTVPSAAADPARAPQGAERPPALEGLLERLACLPGITVDAGRGRSEQLDPRAVVHAGDPRRAADEGQYGPGAGQSQMTVGGRCGRCDSRHCWDGCKAGEPGYVYATGRGYVTFDEADRIQGRWQAMGLVEGVDFGPGHGIRRIEWAAGRHAADAAAALSGAAATAQAHSGERVSRETAGVAGTR